MKKQLIIVLIGILSSVTLFSQETIVKGSVSGSFTLEPIPDVNVFIEGTVLETQTDSNGEFEFTVDLPLGEQIIRISKSGFNTKRYPIVINEGETVNISDMSLEVDEAEANLFTINLTDDQLNSDSSGLDNISGLLQSSQDVLQRTAAFEWSSSFFRLRGLDSENGSVLINGIEMNKLYDGRPQWSDWGGLNDVLRNQELTTGLQPSSYNFGGILGTTNMQVRASSYREGGRVTYSSSDRSYRNRVMASYSSGQLKNGWAYTFMAGRRWGNEGYQEATLYDANSFFAAVEKRINEKHSLNFTAMYTPNRRGKSSPNTQEVYDLKNIRYNEYWGYINGEKINSRIKEVEEPIFMLNHYWDINEKISLNSNVGFQTGKIGNSRLDFAGGANPSPAYYQYLPSFYLADPDGPDYSGAYLAQQNFIDNGQINWDRIFDANQTNASVGLDGAYAVYEDRTDDTQLTINSILSAEINENMLLNAAVTYKDFKSENFGEILNLLGSTGYLNVDAFDGFQFDYQNPNRVLGVGDKYRYNYNMHAEVISGYAQAQFKYSKVDFYVAASFASTTYQRDGLWQNEAYIETNSSGEVTQNNSSGLGEKLVFTGIGTKGGITYKITGKHLVDVNAAYLTKAPSLRNSYSNSRDSQAIVTDITEEKIASLDVSYIYRSPIVKAKLTGFYTKIRDANEISFYYADGLTNTNLQLNETTAFVQEVLRGIDKLYIGAELGIEAQVTPTIKLKGAASVGQYTYDNNPNLYLTSANFIGNAGDGRIDYGQSNMKDYKISGGPQQAYSVGVEYRDPDFWFVGATVNYLSNAYIDISPLTRTQNFYLARDGLPINNYNPAIARELLEQEQFDGYFTVNLIGGKSWKVGSYFIGVFGSVNNLLDEIYKTGGFEQGRNANYNELLTDVTNPERVFGPKYWYGRGATYFLNVNFRF